MIGVVFGQAVGDLQPQGRLARALLAKHHRSGRLGGIAVDLVPSRMVGVADAASLEDQVRLRVFVGKGICDDAVMFEKLLDLHRWLLHPLRPAVLAPWEKGDGHHLPERPEGGHQRAASVVAQMVPVTFFPESRKVI